jgi:hypothetical protein
MSGRRYYYWISARDETGKPYLIFGGSTEEEARQKGLEMLAGVDFEINRYPTRNLAMASAYSRGKRLEQGEGLKRSKQRIGHERSISHLLNRRRMQKRRY